jgi:arginyl-tRNA synthetase
MRAQLAEIFQQALSSAVDQGKLPELSTDVRVHVEKARNPEHGDFATNVAMSLARVARMAPRAIAEIIVGCVDKGALIGSIDVAGPGFINVRLSDSTLHSILRTVRTERDQFGRAKSPLDTRILVEFVSANPTGPLHIGHGRGAVVGDAVASLLEAAGYQVEREYYINDVGNQMRMLGMSLHARVQAELGNEIGLPEGGYQGEYLIPIAQDFVATHGDSLRGVAFEEQQELFINHAKDTILEEIKIDLAHLRISYDTWFPERSLHDSGDVEGAIAELKTRDIIYDRDGAAVFRTTDFGDEDDRVVVRGDGRPTYFAADIAYHRNKISRGFDRVINIWGADHHGYIARVKASLEATGIAPERLEILLIQFVGLVRDGVKVKMSTRSGQFEELRVITDEVGADAVRFFFLMRRHDSHQEFDLEVAKRRSMDNPVFYVQYGHARLCSILRKATAENVEIPERASQAALDTLILPEERQLILAISEYPHVIQRAALAREPHQIAFYLMETIKGFHSYYTRYKATERVLSDDPLKTEGRLALVDGLRVVIAGGLGLLRVSAPERMDAPVERDDQ